MSICDDKDKPICDDEGQPPIERINYVDGQRLTRDLLQTEQDFHVRLREWLSKSLFTSGVADGLEVKLVEGKAVVCPGLAIDKLGRALVLVAQTKELEVTGRYLTISFDEVHVRQSSDGCLIGPVSSCSGSTPTAFRGDTLIRMQPKINFRNRWPEDDREEMEIVLAEFEFASFEDCTATGIRNGPRRFATARQMAGIHTFALEGEKDLDLFNSKKVYFHIRGRTPTKVVLFLRADEFSSLYYTELGQHSHGVGDAGGPRWTEGASGVDSHTHSVTVDSHDHPGGTATATVRAGPDLAYFDLFNNPLSIPPNNRVAVSLISDNLGFGDGDRRDGSDWSLLDAGFSVGNTGLSGDQTPTTSVPTTTTTVSERHTHTFVMPDESGSTGATAAAGDIAQNHKARSGEERLFKFTELFVYISYPGADGNFARVDVTDQIRTQFMDNYGDTDWGTSPGGLLYSRLSDENRIREIRVDLFNNPAQANEQCLGKGQHFLELTLFKDGEDISGRKREGGKVLYNLYVEAE